MPSFGYTVLLPLVVLSLVSSAEGREPATSSRATTKFVSLRTSGRSLGTANVSINATATEGQVHGHNSSVNASSSSAATAGEERSSRHLLRWKQSRQGQRRLEEENGEDLPLVGAAQRFFHSNSVKPDLQDRPTKETSRSKRLRKKEEKLWLGLPKLVWALILAVAAMLGYIACIPFILTQAKRRPRPAFSN